MAGKRIGADAAHDPTVEDWRDHQGGICSGHACDRNLTAELHGGKKPGPQKRAATKKKKESQNSGQTQTTSWLQ